MGGARVSLPRWLEPDHDERGFYPYPVRLLNVDGAKLLHLHDEATYRQALCGVGCDGFVVYTTTRRPVCAKCRRKADLT